MIVDRRAAERLRQLLGIVERELSRLQSTDRRLFKQPFTAERASSLNEDEDLAERVEAFVSRFGRLQDTLGDKVFPTYLAAQGEKVGAFGDNLDRAERLGLVQDAQSWIDMRGCATRWCTNTSKTRWFWPRHFRPAMSSWAGSNKQCQRYSNACPPNSRVGL